jgi:uncharacterized protein (TIGR02147 family)
MTQQFASVFDYADFRKFLEDYQARRQAHDPAFTRSQFCKELGLPNTRSFFNDVVKGVRPLSKTNVERFTRTLGMTAAEAQFFHVLVEFNQAVIPSDRELLFDQLVSLNHAPSRKIMREEFEFYRHWHHTTVFSLLDILDVSEDYTDLGRRIFPPITTAEARDSVALLEKLGLIRRSGEGFWKPTTKTLDTGSYAKDELVRQYQLQCLELSKRAMLLEHREPRNFSTMTLSVSKAGCALIEKKLMKFKSEVRSIAHREEAPADRVYQVNVQFFPQVTPKA